MSNKFTFHVLGLPHTITNKEFTACAYTQKAWKFCKMMGERGHTIYQYGHEESDAPYAENVTVITNEVWKKVYGTHDYKTKLFTYNTEDEAYQTFYKNAIEEIGKRKQKNDFILPFWGAGVRPICDAHPDLITVEPGIGYAGGHWANWKVFESYAIYHAYCGLQAVSSCMQNNYDVVIPNYFDLEEFEFNDKKEDYFLYLGRVYDGKGVNIAIQVTEHLGYKLKIAGQVDSDGPYKDKDFPPHVEFVGYADVEKRKELIKNAKGSFLPSQYVEPFGGVQVENLLCGTPTITTDWGAFSENNINGVTGYRCRTFDDYLQAAIKIRNGEIDYKTCREHGEKFSLENVAPMYEKYFQDVLNVYESQGWYETDVVKVEPKLNVLYFGDCSPGAMGIISRDMQKILKKNHPEINYELLPWETIENYHKFFNEKYWKNYDAIVVNPIQANLTESGWLFEQEDRSLFKSKLIPVYHAELDIPSQHFNYGWYGSWYTTPIGGINNYIVDQIKEKQVESILLPIGVNTEKFKPFKEVKKIKRVGFVGDNPKEDWKAIKRPEMFFEICKQAGVEPVIIKDREHGKEMYEDVDAVICTSTVEGLPTAFAEVVACKIPFISTNVGIVREYNNVKTFENIEQAVEIIQHLNKSSKNITEYVEKLYEDVIPFRSWENILSTYWVPYFKTFKDKKVSDFIETISNSPYSLVHNSYKKNKGTIVDVGCLDWDWSNMFIGNKRVVGVDPQEKTTPEGTELFQGLLGPFDGKVQIEETGIGAQVSSNGDGGWYNILCWKSFCKKFNIDEVSILKINIEGAEYPLLASMDAEDFKKINQIAVSFHDWIHPEQKSQTEAALRLLEENGFTLLETYRPWGWWLAYKNS
jgi:glycosyltransferase involved in cell wall biosynthesis